MSEKFHINPETGNPGKCRALFKCRFGGDNEHYESPEAARKAFETENAHVEIPPAMRDSLNLQNVADKTKSIKEMRMVIEHGSDIALRILAQNPNVPSDLLVAAYKKVEINPTAFLRLVVNPKFPLSEIDERGMEALLNLGTPTSFYTVLGSDEMTDKQAFIVAEKYVFKGSNSLLRNPNNKLTHDGIEALIKADVRNVGWAIEHPNFDLERYFPKDTADRKILSSLARSRTTPSTLKFIYNHPRTRKADKEWLVERYGHGNGYFD